MLEETTSLLIVQEGVSVPKKTMEASVHTTIILLHRTIQPTIATVTSVTNNKKALLPIVQEDIMGAGSHHQRANVLLDLGAQISLIRSAVAEDLRLKGKNLVVMLTKAGGQEEELSTKIYQVCIISLEDRNAHVYKPSEFHQLAMTSQK